VSAFTWPLFNLFTKISVFSSYATEEGLFFMRGRPWYMALVPAIVCAAAILFKKFILARDSRNVVLINFSIYTSMLYILTCQHFLFKRVGMMFISSVMLLIPELIKGLSAKAENHTMADAAAIQQNTTDGVRQQGKRDKIHWEKHFYYYAVSAVIVIGFLYEMCILTANTILVVPYYTFIILW
jgi:hypothetical protein